MLLVFTSPIAISLLEEWNLFFFRFHYCQFSGILSPIIFIPGKENLLTFFFIFQKRVFIFKKGYELYILNPWYFKSLKVLTCPRIFGILIHTKILIFIVFAGHEIVRTFFVKTKLVRKKQFISVYSIYVGCIFLNISVFEGFVIVEKTIFLIWPISVPECSITHY